MFTRMRKEIQITATDCHLNFAGGSFKSTGCILSHPKWAAGNIQNFPKIHEISHYTVLHPPGQNVTHPQKFPFVGVKLNLDGQFSSRLATGSGLMLSSFNKLTRLAYQCEMAMPEVLPCYTGCNLGCQPTHT